MLTLALTGYFLMLDYSFVDIDYYSSKIKTATLHDENFKFHLCASHFLLHAAIRSTGNVHSLKALASDLKRYLNILYIKGGELSIFPADYCEVNDHQMNAYIIHLQDDGLSDKTIVRHISSISGFYKHAYEYGFIEYPKEFSFNAARGERRLQLVEKSTSQVLTHYLNEDDFTSILTHVEAKSHFKRMRDEMALMLGYYLGLRTHELVSYGNFNLIKLKEQFPSNNESMLSEGFISITGKRYKTRSVPMVFEVKKLLYRFLYGDLSRYIKNSIFECVNNQVLTDASYGTNVFRTAKQNYLSSNSVSDLHRKSVEYWGFHSLRHTCATNYVSFCEDGEQGKYNPFIQLPQWLGHSNPETTKIYIWAEAIKNKRFSMLRKLEELSMPDGVNG